MERCAFSATEVIARIISGTVLLAILSCGPRFDWEGQWRGDRKLTTPPGGDSSVAKTLGRIQLTISPGGTFELIEAGMPKTGRIRTSGMTATLTADRIGGRPVSRLSEAIQKMNVPIRLVGLTDGNIEFTDPGGFYAEGVTLRRQSKP